MKTIDRIGASPEGSLLERLEALDARLERLERTLEPLSALVARLEGLERQGPALTATALDSFDQAVARAEARGLQPQVRLDELGRLLEQATTPETLAVLRELLDAVGRAPALAATAADVLDGLLARLSARGIVLDQRVELALRALDHLTHPDMIDVLEHALKTGSLRSLVVSTDVLAPEAVEVVGCAARALIDTHRAPAQEAGPLALLRALRRPEVRQAAGFAVTFAENFGRRLAGDGCAPSTDATQEDCCG